MPSPAEVVTSIRARRCASQTAKRRTLIFYALGAVCVRMLDAGTGVSVLLLAYDRLTPGTAGRSGGLLVALFTVPHLAGPLIARRLDLASDYRRFLGAGYLLMAAMLVIAAWSLGRSPLAVTALLVSVAGFGGPLVTGGLSSRLLEVVPADHIGQRRLQSLDAALYGIAGTVGPALAAGVSGLASPMTAFAVLCGGAAASAVLIQALPKLAAAPLSSVPSVRRSSRPSSPFRGSDESTT